MDIAFAAMAIAQAEAPGIEFKVTTTQLPIALPEDWIHDSAARIDVMHCGSPDGDTRPGAHPVPK